MKSLLNIAALSCALGLASVASAQVTVNDPWVRGTVAQLKATGAFMQLTATEASRLVGVASPVAGTVEIHEMKMDAGVMKMRPITGLDLPAGKMVELRPGGYHVMLIDLKQPIAEGATVPLTLTVETKAGKRSTIEVQASVRALGTPAPAGGAQQHKH